MVMLALLMLLVPVQVQATTLTPVQGVGHASALATSNNSSYNNFMNIMNRIKTVVIAIGAIIVTIMWVWEGIFMLIHRDDKEGVLRFKHDLIYLLIASLIILGASAIVSLLAWIVS
ncbi:MAG: TrbC/VirB2 family protein [Thermoplasmata archaeon]